jgi:hypothetical protein
MVINFKTAKALGQIIRAGLTVSGHASLCQRANGLKRADHPPLSQHRGETV